MFPAGPKTSAAYEEKLVALGDAMRYTRHREGTLTPRIGYTYFGQFVGHDISHDGTPLAGPYAEPEATPNFRTPWLDLDHLYGGGPELSPHVYTGASGAELFKIGLTSPSGYARDIAFEGDTLLVADRHDARNLDNLILRQLQVVFLKLHNEAVRQLSTPGSPLRRAADLRNETVFSASRRLVGWHYQWLVRHEFLPRILQPAFWARRARRAVQRVTGTAIPVEFALAAFRYGHSIVRSTYPLNCRRHLVGLVDLLREGQRPSPLGDDLVLEWGRYFDGLPRSGPPAASSFIDTAIVEPLHSMPTETVRLCSRTGNTSESARLAERTLLRGARSSLPIAQEVSRTLVAEGAIEEGDALTAAELTADAFDRSGSTLARLGLSNETPLFYYLLKEAELRSGGLSLGPIGSYTVGEVLLHLLEADPDGYVAGAGVNWQLPAWTFPNGTEQQVTSISAAIRLIGDHKLLPECARKAASYSPAAIRDQLLESSLASPAVALN